MTDYHNIFFITMLWKNDFHNICFQENTCDLSREVFFGSPGTSQSFIILLHIVLSKLKHQIIVGIKFNTSETKIVMPTFAYGLAVAL